MNSRLLLCRACSWNRALDYFLHVPASRVSYRPCIRWLHQYKVRFSRVKTKERLLSDSYGQPRSSNACQSKPKSTSTAVIGKTVNNAEEQENLSNAATKNEDTEEEWMEQKTDWKKLPRQYMQLSKIRLTGLVVITEMAGYAIAPGAMHLSTFLLAGLGTGLCSSSANALNQWLEVPFDSQMSRTQNRVLVRGRLSPLHVVLFGAVTGALGVSVLLTQINGLTAALGAATLLLYTSVYTPMKRLSILNTWVGSVVGALPPLMGWAACTGGLDAGGLVLAGILYSWQFPHFNALSWNLRADYSRAGYRMMCVTNAPLCRRVTLRHCLALVGLTTLLPVCGVTTWWLALDSLPLNVWNIYLGYQFYKDSDSKSARKLFRFSLLYLPILMLMILLHKKPRTEQEEGVVQVA
ncbi:Protoheme IX farnesyltransferase, mitochondrial [Desmophyllum pertusum]|uniref:Protoheme IX farnesyltransferase, mitochondrial n=1 Tax=Desmophyllum pertusum TaxID=174260 RepID=A0A9X0CMN8_9CNID|nr:Protoheme IX farnesyltransferase, mitochondrial [Desmophyllum pertusum]